jgi:hypothetical protein
MLLGAFAKVRKMTVSFVMSTCLFVCPSVRMEQTTSNGQIWKKFDIWVFSKICRQSSSLFKILQKTGILHDYISLGSSLNNKSFI